tara:strand:+ start:260 stop:637 length:378 start_codon:yes stop_codon:yes gene_type:complete
MKMLRVPAHVINEIDDAISSRKKIQAIKILRNAAGCGLKEAKLAIDRREGKTNRSDAPSIGALVSIKSVTIDMGDGNGSVVLDLDAMNMMTLVGMKSLGIEETRRVLDLHDFLIKWEKNIALSDE